jgi:hypothetical protein
MNDLSPEQKKQRLILTGQLIEHYRKLFTTFFTVSVYDLPPEMIVLSGAYKINREEIALEQAKGVIDARIDTINKTPDPRQLKLF